MLMALYVLLPRTQTPFTLHDGPPYANGDLHIGESVMGAKHRLRGAISGVGQGGSGGSWRMNDNIAHSVPLKSMCTAILAHPSFPSGHALNKVLKDIINR